VNRFLPPDAAEPGLFRPERTPYVIPISRAISSGKYNRIVAVMACQMGKSDLALNTIGQVMDDNPVPILYVAPTQKLVTSISRDRVTKMFRYAPSLSRKINEGGLDHLTEKWISGTALRFLWASSATEMSAHPACIVILDEIDRMPEDIRGEGSPMTLAEARTSTYPDALILVVSTPTIEGHSPVWRLWEAGTALVWCWPCLGCGVYFAPMLALLKWADGANKDSVYDEGAWVECPECGHKHYEEDKESLNANGIYLGKEQDARIKDGKTEISGEVYESLIGSFRVSGLCSPFKPFTFRASKFLEAAKEGTEEDIKGVINTQFGELFKIKGDAPAPTEVDALKLDYPLGEVHAGAIVLTCGVDVQKRCLYYVVRAWGEKDESWIVQPGILWGDTHSEHVWEKLEALLVDGEWAAATGEKYKIFRLAIDSQYRTDMVYGFAERHKGAVLACDGTDRRLGAPVGTSNVSVTPSGRKIKGGLTLWKFDKHYFRTWIYGRMRRGPDEDGRWNLSDQVDGDYCKQIVAEEMIAKPSGAIVWVMRQGYRDNHYLDAEVHARVAAHVVNVDLLVKRRSNPPQRRVVMRVRK